MGRNPYTVVSAFSRDDEREADIYGAWYAFQDGYEVEKGLMVWEWVAAVDENAPFLSTYFLDSHPAPLERKAMLKKMVRYFQAGWAADIFLAAKDLNSKPFPQQRRGARPPYTGSITVTQVFPGTLVIRISPP